VCSRASARANCSQKASCAGRARRTDSTSTSRVASTTRGVGSAPRSRRTLKSFRLGREQVVGRHVDERLDEQRGPAAPGGDAGQRRHPALDRLDRRHIAQSRAVQAVKQYRGDRHENAGYLNHAASISQARAQIY
jgi:hypothetical protein